MELAYFHQGHPTYALLTNPEGEAEADQQQKAALWKELVIRVMVKKGDSNSSNSNST